LLGRAVLAIFIVSLLDTQIAEARHRVPPALNKKVRGTIRGRGNQPHKKLSRYAPIHLFEVNTKENFRLRFQDDRGRPIRGWQKRFDRFMRCHKTGMVGRINPRLPRLLYQTGRYFNGRKLEIISGFRHPKVARNPKSPHKHGLACDFRVVGIPNAVLRDYLRKTFKHVGVGYYPNSTFVHLDVRKGPSAFWIDYSGPGQDSQYSENPREDLKNGRADSYHPAPTGMAQDESRDDIEDATRAGRKSNAGSIVLPVPQDPKTFDE
jgi:uncharacterized protein YcbK (DUF882 family)